MKPQVVALTLLMGLMTVIGQVEERGAAPGAGPGSTSLPNLQISLAAPAQAQQTGRTPGYGEVDAIFVKYHCSVCHGSAEPRSGLNLEDYTRLMKGGKGGPMVIPGDPAKSELVRRLKGASEPRMPYTGPPWLADDEVATIEAWIAAGAKAGQ